MGTTFSRRRTKPFKINVNAHLLKNLKFLEEEVVELSCKRDEESLARERLVTAFTVKQAEWRRERRRWRDEVRRLQKRLEERDEMVSSLEDEGMVGAKGDKEGQIERVNLLVEHLREEQARREEAVVKWKQLYLAIKTELDDLIARTSQGERFWWGAEDNTVERLQTELKAKEEIMEALRAQISAMKDVEVRREREVDILRQSLRILSTPVRRTLS